MSPTDPEKLKQQTQSCSCYASMTWQSASSLHIYKVSMSMCITPLHVTLYNEYLGVARFPLYHGARRNCWVRPVVEGLRATIFPRNIPLAHLRGCFRSD